MLGWIGARASLGGRARQVCREEAPSTQKGRGEGEAAPRGDEGVGLDHVVKDRLDGARDRGNVSACDGRIRRRLQVEQRLPMRQEAELRPVSLREDVQHGIRRRPLHHRLHARCHLGARRPLAALAQRLRGVKRAGWAHVAGAQVQHDVVPVALEVAQHRLFTSSIVKASSEVRHLEVGNRVERSVARQLGRRSVLHRRCGCRNGPESGAANEGVEPLRVQRHGTAAPRKMPDRAKRGRAKGSICEDGEGVNGDQRHVLRPEPVFATAHGERGIARRIHRAGSLRRARA